MVYTRNPTWQNSPSIATPITAAALENIEAGLVNAANVADSSITALAGKEPAISRTGATTGQVATLQAGGALAFATPAAGGGTVAAATTTTQGIVQLAGDLAGTAAAPTVPALATQAAAIATKAPLLIPTMVKTTAYTAISGDLVRADATTASFAVTLPAAVVGSTLAVKKVDTSVNTVTITPNGTDTIDGLTSAVLRLPNATQRLIAVTGGWVVADGFNLLSALDARFDAAGAAATREPAISRTGATTGQVPVLQAGGGLAFATPAAGGSTPSLATGINTYGAHVPAGSLNKWVAARNNATTTRCEVRIFGDSTLYGQTTNPLFSWAQELRIRCVAAGYGDGGRGNNWTAVQDPYVAFGSEPAVVSANTGWTTTNGGSALPYSLLSTVLNSTVTFNVVGTSARLWHSRFTQGGGYSYSVNGAAAITVYPSRTPVTPGVGGTWTAEPNLITGLTGGGATNTITVVNLGGIPAVGPASLTDQGSTVGTIPAGTYYYRCTFVTAVGETTTGTGLIGPVTVNGSQSRNVFLNSPASATSVNLYRSTNSSTGFVKVATATAVQNTQVADTGATPTTAAPTVSTAGMDSTYPTVAVNIEALNSTGVTWHNQGVPGQAYSSYFNVIDSQNNPGALAVMGLQWAAGVPSEQVGPVANSGVDTPMLRSAVTQPSLVILAHGINDVQTSIYWGSAPAAPTLADAGAGKIPAGTYYYRVSQTLAEGETIQGTQSTGVTVTAALPTPVNAAFTTATTGGILAGATYYYQVTATNVGGETLASTETSIVVPTATATNTVTLNWGAVTGATGYRVYGRTTAGELFIAAVGAVTTYTDTGSVTPSGAVPTTNTTPATHAITVTLPDTQNTYSVFRTNVNTGNCLYVGTATGGTFVDSSATTSTRSSVAANPGGIYAKVTLIEANVGLAIRMARNAGADVLVVLPSIELANDSRYVGPTIKSAIKRVADAYGCATVDEDIALGGNLAGRTALGYGLNAGSNPHLNVGAYTALGDFIWDRILKL